MQDSNYDVKVRLLKQRKTRFPRSYQSGCKYPNKRYLRVIYKVVVMCSNVATCIHSNV